MIFPIDKNLIAFISDSSINFMPTDFDAPLTQEQVAYLKTQTGYNIPQVYWRKQVHGDEIIKIEGQKIEGHVPIKGCCDADAFITNEKNLPIAIRTADCVPVFLYDSKHHAVGLVHAGWQGTAIEITAKTVKRMQEKFGTNPQDLKTVIGPSIRTCCYEVGQEFKAHFPEDIVTRGGKLYADVAGNNRKQLLSSGVLTANIVDTGLCTHCSKNYFSFRRDADRAGRMISLMMLL